MMHLTLTRTASGMSCLLAAAAVAMPVALARDDHATRPRIAFRSASYAVDAAHDPSRPSSPVFPPYAQFGLYLPGDALVARVDAGAPIGAMPMMEPTVAAAPVDAERYFGIDLPRPNRWGSVLATLALIGFFFLRRIV